MDDKVSRYVAKTQKMLINGKWVAAASGKIGAFVGTGPDLRAGDRGDAC